LGISPGSVNIAFPAAQQEPFASKSRMNIICIYYLYGVQYYWTKGRNERIAAVKQCLETADARESLLLR
jgi:hypothetical protein